MPSLLVKVKTTMSIYAHEKVRGILEGEYGSVFKGRSMDFDDLREYIPGDDIKDIDWKATARSGQTLIKRYIAVRKHNILLVTNTGKSMAALAQSGDSKRDIAVMTAGIMGYIAQKHGDLVALVSGDSGNSSYIPLRGSDPHLERILQHIHGNTTPNSSHGNILQQLDYIARTIRRRMILTIISDDIVMTPELEKLLRRLSVQHEIMWITVGDATPTHLAWRNQRVEDITLDSDIPAFLRGDKTLSTEIDQALNHTIGLFSQSLKRLKISSQHITSEKNVVYDLLRLLEKQRYARRH